MWCLCDQGQIKAQAAVKGILIRDTPSTLQPPEYHAVFSLPLSDEPTNAHEGEDGINEEHLVSKGVISLELAR